MRLRSHPDAHSTPADCAACRASIRHGSHSFHLASLLLPVSIREPSYAVYAFCRMADDLIDREEGGSGAIDALGLMLDRIYDGRPAAHFVERGFADVVHRFAIPRAVPDALIEGLSWDADGRRYETLGDLTAYAVRVAGTVGFMMTLVMGNREPRVLARACDLGVAMQLTNIARDIGEDARNGRIYMPLEWLRHNGVEPDVWLDRPTGSPEISSVVVRLLAEAERLYDRSLAGVAALPAGCRMGINTARLFYREIGREIVRGTDPVTTRAVTTRKQKLRLLAEASATRVPDHADRSVATIPAADFLLAAVSSTPAPRRVSEIPPWWDLGRRTERLVEMLAGFAARAAANETGAGVKPFLFQDQPERAARQ